MARVIKRDLIKRGASQLDSARKMVARGGPDALELADRQIAIANAYARLADALGDSGFSE